MSDDLFRRTRAMFDLPKGVVYLDGNSLGAMPTSARERVRRELDESWGRQLIRAWNSAGWIDLPVLLQRYWLTMRGAVGELSPRGRSCGAVEQVGDDDGLAPDIMTVNLSKLSLPHHRHRFETRQSSPRGMETAEAEPRPDKALDTPVVLLDDVVEVFALPQTGAAR